MTVVYADSVFLLNAAMDYLMFLLTARLAGLTLQRRRYFFTAVLGGAYAVAVFLPGLSFLTEMPVKAAVGILLALVAFGGEQRLLRLILLLFGVSCAMAGCVLGLGLLSGSKIPAVNGIFYTNVNATVLLIAAAASYIMLSLVFRASAKHGVRGELLPVTIHLAEKSISMTALWDTGNELHDPVSQKNVLIVEPHALLSLLSTPIRNILTEELMYMPPADLLEKVRHVAPELRPRLIPYHAVGTTDGLLLAILSDWTEIGGKREEAVPIAVSPTAFGNGYTALWGGEIRNGGEHGNFQSVTKDAVKI